MSTSTLVCPQCGDEHPPENTYCTDCGTQLELIDNTTELTKSSETDTDPGATALTRLGVLSLLLALVSGYAGAAFLYASRVGFQTGFGRMQTTYSLVYYVNATFYRIPLAAVYLTIAVVFGLIGISGIRRWPRTWIMGLSWYAVLLLLLALVPPPTLWAVPIAALGLYWAYRGRTYSPPPPDDTEPMPKQSTRSGQASPSRQGSILAAILWMGGVSLLLFWIPVLGPLIAGYVGGNKAGSALSGFIAAALPALLLGGIFLAVGVSQNLSVIGALLGGAATLFVLLHSTALVVGALIGGVLT